MINFEKEMDILIEQHNANKSMSDAAVLWAKSIAARVEREAIERCRLEQSHSSTWYEPELLYSPAPSGAAKGEK